MMNKIILTVFCLTSILSITTSINLNCSYQDCDFYVISSSYSCKIQSSSSLENTYVSITGTHGSSKTNNDVVGICGGLGNIQEFPKGLKRIFKNLKAFYVSGGIKEIHQEDLIPYPDLIVLLLDHNRIETIEEGLFDYNPNLEAISFWNNPIVHIDANSFDNLPKLRYYWMSGCADVSTENNRAIVLTEIIKAKSLCIRVTTEAPTILNQGCSDAIPGKDFSTLIEKIDYLTTKVLILDAKFTSFTEEYEK